ncbi:copper-binding protein [Nitrincola nitratireducens]|uniref:Uncharacterized protein n=1 Tax=Nitrincola nitratireducens TaxID=1229521 RepID=W9V1Q5_9GAMM|nr:copper-binding protein [Nitrincola nitratireducens]EXJ10861.1 hypothetical protein D791_02226 [Nitrincola nitratireducens]
MLSKKHIGVKSILAAIAISVSGMAWSAGDLTQRPERLEPIQLGKLTDTELLDYFMEPKEYTFETGKSYRLKIQASGLKEYAFQAPKFFESIYIRKVEAGGVEIKGVGLTELEFEDKARPRFSLCRYAPVNFHSISKVTKSVA